MRKALLVMVGTVAVLSLAVAVAAAAHDGNDGKQRDAKQHEDAARLYSAALAPSVPSDPPIHGAAAGGAPWVIDRGSVKLQADGRLIVSMRGLVIPVAHGTFPAGTARPVTTVSASLYCGADATAAVATTGAVAISEDGDARIDDRIALPATCLSPTLLVHPNGNAGAYIALPGWRQ